ncbi:MAG: CoA-acylating methylmalonate-semialdehyde dehydrogenase [Dehalococcoidia bacterium]|nr:CoA-acylating methylmalonate-semialdehyde dehydrogenase [Dehalococcoidia bacterium]
MSIRPEVKKQYGLVPNYINGAWVNSMSTEVLDVENPATGEVIGQVPLSTKGEVDAAVRAASVAFPGWRDTPPQQRVQYLFRLKVLVEEHQDEMARIIVQEEGKTYREAFGEVGRGIENIERAAGIPSLMMGRNLEEVARGIDEYELRQPLGVFCCIAPFNFPAMIPLWFLPYAVACGNTYVVKPSEQVPLTQNRLFQLIHQAGFPEGVLNLVNGAKDVVDALLDHPDIRGVSFVGSTPVAQHVYSRAAANGKRAQCQAGAKNYLVVMPDADLEATVDALIESCFGSAGERCLAGSVVVPVGDITEPLQGALTDAARAMKVGYGLDDSVHMGPVISARHRDRVLAYIERGVQEGARLILDGRTTPPPNRSGYFVNPTIFEGVTPEMTIAREEIFGPVASIMPARSLDEALDFISRIPYGNSASIFTKSGKWAREFQHRVVAGNVGINVGIPAPVAPFPFSGAKRSFFGDLHGQGIDSIFFFTERKVVITRWW